MTRLFPCSFYDWHTRGFHDLIFDVTGQGRELVVVNGVFDLLHRGHVALFRTAAEVEQQTERPPVVIAALNSDASAWRLKGAHRPVQTLDDRLAVVSALRYVDVAVGFGEDTPEELIQLLRPLFLVKGEEHRGQRPIPGASYALGIIWVPMVHEIHTTDLVNRIVHAGQGS